MNTKLEDCLGGGFSGLYGEVVTCDTYRLRSVAFQPDIIFDIGANVGVFARFARTLFPDALIVSVEPHPANIAVYKKHTNDMNTMLVERALGRGKIFHGTTARNGSGETYLSAGLGYPLEQMESAVAVKAGLEDCQVPTVTLPKLYEVASSLRLYPGKLKTLLKMDCEGAENTVWEDPNSMHVLRCMDYIAMEVHFYGLTGPEHKKVNAVTRAALHSLEETHNCELDGVHFWATKK